MGRALFDFISKLDSSFSFLGHSFLAKAVLTSLLKIICLLVALAYSYLAERKIMAASQRRQGPDTTGFFGMLRPIADRVRVLGIFQPIADGVKLLTKDIIWPTASRTGLFLLAPAILLILRLATWAVIPFGVDEAPPREDSSCCTVELMTITTGKLFPGRDWSDVRLLEESQRYLFNVVQTKQYVYDCNYVPPSLASQWEPWSGVADINYGVLFVLAISSCHVCCLILAGWASNSKYAFLGALRSAARMMSCEIVMGLSILPVALLAGSVNLTDIVVAQGRTGWYLLPLLPCAIIFFIPMCVEIETPFDLTEMEADLVAGYSTEYSSIMFVMFSLAEKSRLLLMSFLYAIFFLGGWTWFPFTTLYDFPPSAILTIKAVGVFFSVILVRAAFPRYRYDQLMTICWKMFLPAALAFLIFLSWVLLFFDATPVTVEFVTNDLVIQHLAEISLNTPTNLVPYSK